MCEYLDTRQGVAQVALFDYKTHRSYLFSNGDNTQYAASVAKADILAMRLHHYDEHRTTISDGIPYSIKYPMAKRIENSDRRRPRSGDT